MADQFCICIMVRSEKRKLTRRGRQTAGQAILIRMATGCLVTARVQIYTPSKSNKQHHPSFVLTLYQRTQVPSQNKTWTYICSTLCSMMIVFLTRVHAAAQLTQWVRRQRTKPKYFQKRRNGRDRSSLLKCWRRVKTYNFF